MNCAKKLFALLLLITNIIKTGDISPSDTKLDSEQALLEHILSEPEEATGEIDIDDQTYQDVAAITSHTPHIQVQNVSNDEVRALLIPITQFTMLSQELMENGQFIDKNGDYIYLPYKPGTAKLIHTYTSPEDNQELTAISTLDLKPEYAEGDYKIVITQDHKIKIVKD